MRRIVSTLAALALCSAPLAVSAKPPAMMKKVLKEKVGLTDKQIEQIQQLQYKADREKLDIRHEIQKARLDMQQLMQADRPDKLKVFAKIEKVGDLEVKLKKNRIGLMLEIRKLVTSEQWQKMEMLHAERKMKRRERRRRHMGGPGGPGGHGGPGFPMPPEPPEPPMD